MPVVALNELCRNLSVGARTVVVVGLDDDSSGETVNGVVCDNQADTALILVILLHLQMRPVILGNRNVAQN